MLILRYKLSALALLILVLPSCIPKTPETKAIVAPVNSPPPTVSPSPETTPPVDTMKSPEPNEIEVPIKQNPRSGNIDFDFTQAKTLKVLGSLKPEDFSDFCGKESKLAKPTITSAERDGNRVSCVVGMAFYGDSQQAVLDWGIKSVKKARIDGNFGIPVAPDKSNKGWMVYFVGKPFTRHLDGLCTSIFKDTIVNYKPENRIIALEDGTCRYVLPQ